MHVNRILVNRPVGHQIHSSPDRCVCLNKYVKVVWNGELFARGDLVKTLHETFVLGNRYRLRSEVDKKCKAKKVRQIGKEKEM